VPVAFFEWRIFLNLRRRLNILLGRHIVKCDLFLLRETISPHFRFLSIFDKNFRYQDGQVYSGYMGLNVERIKLVSVVVELRKKGVDAFNVPVRYRDQPKLTKEERFKIAKQHAGSRGDGVAFGGFRTFNATPMLWSFPLLPSDESKVGGVVYVDTLDGHFWDLIEYDEYMHDYNAILC